MFFPGIAVYTTTHPQLDTNNKSPTLSIGPIGFPTLNVWYIYLHLPLKKYQM